MFHKCRLLRAQIHLLATCQYFSFYSRATQLIYVRSCDELDSHLTHAGLTYRILRMKPACMQVGQRAGALPCGKVRTTVPFVLHLEPGGDNSLS